MKNLKYLSVDEISRLLGKSKPDVRSLIARKQIKAHKVNENNRSKWKVAVKDFEKYQKNKLSKNNIIFEYSLLYDSDKGECSMIEAEKTLNISYYRIKNLLKNGKLKFTKKGCHYVLKIKDIEAYRRKIS